MTIPRPVKEALWRWRLPRRVVVAARHRGISRHDVFLVSYPKSGNTWMKALLTYLITGHAFDFDADPAVVAPVGQHARAPRVLNRGGRVIKSHEPYDAWYSGRYERLIYLVRDGRDVAISYYHALRRLSVERRPFTSFLDSFLAGQVEGYGPWQDHVVSWLDSRQASDGRLHLVRYEDLVADPIRELEGVARFLGLEYPRERLDAAVGIHTVPRMRESEVRSAMHARSQRPDQFIVRKGRPGEWREWFTAGDEARFAAVATAALERLRYPSSSPPLSAAAARSGSA